MRTVRPFSSGFSRLSCQIEHVLFHWRRVARLLFPRLVNIDVTRRATARAPAFGDNTWDGVLYGRLHHRLAGFAFHRVHLTAAFYICDLHHGTAKSLAGLFFKGDRPKIQSRNVPLCGNDATGLGAR